MMSVFGLAMVLITSILVTKICGEGVVEIRFLYFGNPNGEGNNGHCCDGRWGILCQSNACDQMFTICLDDVNSTDSTGSCRYGYTQSGAIKDHNNIKFGDTIDNITNPVVFEIHGTLPRVMALKVDVYDKDWPSFNSHDHVDFLRTNIQPKGTDVVQGNSQPYVLTSRCRLFTTVVVRCADNYYGASCDTFCAPPRPDQQYYCDPVTGSLQPRDCDVLADGGKNLSGSYPIYGGELTSYPVFCEFTPDGKGWTVIQQRVDDSVNFTRGWQDYKEGFGYPIEDRNFWMGLEHLHHLTNSYTYKLRIDLEFGPEGWYYAEYERFWIEDGDHLYRVHFRNYSGNAGDSFGAGIMDEATRSHEGMPFSTYDQDNDHWPNGHCAKMFKSGWWFNQCYRSNLNGVYNQDGGRKCSGECIYWLTNRQASATRVEMKLWPNNEGSVWP